ncbi:MAG: 1,4-alpha-glucan branching protein, partial [Sediminibacterium sp.]|nr:1,4-alpha-glucan branching protein [Sediminibacterium sp.]
VDALRDILYQYNQAGEEQDLKLWFTANHDENSWNGTEYEKYGDAAKAFAVFSCTWNGIPLIYSGQEEPILRAIPFFEKDTMRFSLLERAAFYTKLNQLRANNAALRPDATFTAQSTNQPNQVLAFLRSFENKKVLVVVNLTATESRFNFSGTAIAGNYKDIFSGAPVSLTTNQSMYLEPWGYRVYELVN